MHLCSPPTWSMSRWRGVHMSHPREVVCAPPIRRPPDRRSLSMAHVSRIGCPRAHRTISAGWWPSVEQNSPPFPILFCVRASAPARRKNGESVLNKSPAGALCAPPGPGPVGVCRGRDADMVHVRPCCQQRLRTDPAHSLCCESVGLRAILLAHPSHAPIMRGCGCGVEGARPHSQLSHAAAAMSAVAPPLGVPLWARRAAAGCTAKHPAWTESCLHSPLPSEALTSAAGHCGSFIPLYPPPREWMTNPLAGARELSFLAWAGPVGGTPSTPNVPRPVDRFTSA